MLLPLNEIPDKLRHFRNMKEFNADYVGIYQTENSELDSKWIRAGFAIAGHFSWAGFEQELGSLCPYTGSAPDWWLLRKD